MNITDRLYHILSLTPSQQIVLKSLSKNIYLNQIVEGFTKIAEKKDDNTIDKECANMVKSFKKLDSTTGLFAGIGQRDVAKAKLFYFSEDAIKYFQKGVSDYNYNKSLDGFDSDELFLINKEVGKITDLLNETLLFKYTKSEVEIAFKKG
jgi:hypothetical protein